MVLVLLEKLKKQWEENLQKLSRELDKTLDPVHESFIASGIRIPVWRSLGSRKLAEGITVDGYLGYAEMGGVWGLLVRTIERDDKTGAVLGSRIEKLGALSPFIKEAASEIRELLQQMELLSQNRIQDLKAAQEIIE